MLHSWLNLKFGINGSGMHCNMSLFDYDGNNVFFDTEDSKGMQLSENSILLPWRFDETRL